MHIVFFWFAKNRCHAAKSEFDRTREQRYNTGLLLQADTFACRIIVIIGGIPVVGEILDIETPLDSIRRPVRSVHDLEVSAEIIRQLVLKRSLPIVHG